MLIYNIYTSVIVCAIFNNIQCAFVLIGYSDRRMLDSPQKSNIKYGESGLSISGTEQFERKLSSPKSSKPKRVPSEKSPVLEAFIKGVKKHHRDHGVHESRQPCVSLDTKYSKAVTKYVPPSYLLSKETKKKHQSSEGRKSHFIHENSREKNDGNRGRISADSKKQATVAEADIFKNSSRSLSSRSSLSRHHPGESPLGAKFQLSLASYCRERELKRLRREQMEQRINSENSFSEASNLSLKSSSIERKCKPRQELSKQNDVTPGNSNLSNLVCAINAKFACYCFIIFRILNIKMFGNNMVPFVREILIQKLVSLSFLQLSIKTFLMADVKQCFLPLIFSDQKQRCFLIRKISILFFFFFFLR